MRWTLKTGNIIDEPIAEVCICLMEDYRVRELAEHLAGVAVVC